MGYEMSVDVVPYVIHDVFYVRHNDTWEGLTEEQQMLLDPENWAAGSVPATRHLRKELEDNPRLEATVRGWTIHLFTTNPKHEDIGFGKRGRIWAHIWRKGDYMVGLMNESEFDMIGETRLAVLANDRASIVAFKKDFELPGDIEEMDAVQQQ